MIVRDLREDDAEEVLEEVTVVQGSIQGMITLSRIRAESSSHGYEKA